MMHALIIQRKSRMRRCRRIKPDRTTDAAGQGDRNLINRNDQMIVAPLQPAGADRQMRFIAAEFSLGPFGHAPDFGPGFIKRQIHRAMIFWIAQTPAPGPGIIG